jgi:hypothetical protein
MKSNTLPSFWEAYKKLAPDTQKRARKVYRLWAADSFHPSLHFKCVNSEEDIWSVRITLGVRSLGVLDGDTVTWFWVGDHDDYKRFFG